MKPYGIPRNKYILYPDIGDIQEYALKSSTGKSPSKSGDYKPYIRKSSRRKSIRRYYKKKERRLTKSLLL